MWADPNDAAWAGPDDAARPSGSAANHPRPTSTFAVLKGPPRRTAGSSGTANGVQRTEFGYGATVSVVLFVFSLVFALAYQRYALRRDTAGAVTRAVI